MTLSQRLLFMAGFAGFFIGTAYWNPVTPKDAGQWGHVDQATRDWFKSLKNPKTQIPCCDTSDAHQLAEDQWKQEGSKYLIQFEGRWFEVPPDAVLNVQSKPGGALVFISPTGHIYCFIPGALS